MRGEKSSVGYPAVFALFLRHLGDTELDMLPLSKRRITSTDDISCTGFGHHGGPEQSAQRYCPWVRCGFKDV